MATSFPRSSQWSVRPICASTPMVASRRGDGGFSRAGSLPISLVVMLFAALLIATPPLALLVGPPDAPAPAPVPQTKISVSLFA